MIQLTSHIELPLETYNLLQEKAAAGERLRALINSPELLDFREAVVREAAHQRERWGSEHDSGKTPADWHWLVAHLAGRALSHAQELQRISEAWTVVPPEIEQMLAHHRVKAVHHCVTTAAAIANWHAAMLGLTNMRPGIAAPVQQGGQHG